MVSIIEIIANLIIVAFAMAAIALIVALISLAATLFGKKFKPFFKKGLWFTLLAPLLFAYGIFIERNQCQVVNVNIESEKVPESFNDYKIVQISDLHLHSFKGRSKTLQKFVDVINEQSADIVVFTGDLVSYGPWELDGLDTILSKIKAKDGVYSVGRHHRSYSRKLQDYFSMKINIFM